MFVNLSLILLLFGSRYRLPPSPPHIHTGRQCPRVIPYDTALRQVAKSGTWFINRVTATSTWLKPYTCMKAEFSKHPSNKKGLTIEFQGLLPPDKIETATVHITPSESGIEGIFEIDPNARYLDLKATSIISHKTIGEHEYIVLYACLYLPETHRYCDGGMILSRQPRLYLQDLEELNKDLNRRQEKPIFMRHIFDNADCEKFDERIKENHQNATEAPKHMVPLISEDFMPEIQGAGDKEHEIKAEGRNHDNKEVMKVESTTTVNDPEIKKDEESLNEKDIQNNTESPSTMNSRSLPQPQPVKCPYLLSLTTPKPASTEIKTRPRKLGITKPAPILASDVKKPAATVRKPAFSKSVRMPASIVDKTKVSKSSKPNKTLSISVRNTPVLTAKKRKPSAAQFEQVGHFNSSRKNYPKKLAPESPTRAWRLIIPAAQNIKSGRSVGRVVLPKAKKRNADPSAYRLRVKSSFRANEGSPNFGIKGKDQKRENKTPSNKYRKEAVFVKMQRSPEISDKENKEKPKKADRSRGVIKPPSSNAYRIIQPIKDRKGQQSQRSGLKYKLKMNKVNRDVQGTKLTSSKEPAYRNVKPTTGGIGQQSQRSRKEAEQKTKKRYMVEVKSAYATINPFVSGKEQRSQRAGGTSLADEEKKKAKSFPKYTRGFSTYDYLKNPAFRIIKHSSKSSDRMKAGSPKNNSDQKRTYRFIHDISKEKNYPSQRFREMFQPHLARYNAISTYTKKPAYRGSKTSTNGPFENEYTEKNDPATRRQGNIFGRSTHVMKPVLRILKNDTQIKKTLKTPVMKKPTEARPVLRNIKKNARDVRQRPEKQREYSKRPSQVESREKIVTSPKSTKTSQKPISSRGNAKPGHRSSKKYRRHEQHAGKIQQNPIIRYKPTSHEVETFREQNTIKSSKGKNWKRNRPTSFKKPGFRMFEKPAGEEPNKKKRSQEQIIKKPTETIRSKNKKRNKSNQSKLAVFKRTENWLVPKKTQSQQPTDDDDEEMPNEVQASSSSITDYKRKRGKEVIKTIDMKDEPEKKKRVESSTVSYQETSAETRLLSGRKTSNEFTTKKKKRNQSIKKPGFRMYNKYYDEQESKKRQHSQMEVFPEAITDNESSARRIYKYFEKPSIRTPTFANKQGSNKMKHNKNPAVKRQGKSAETETSPESSIGNKHGAKKITFKKPSFRIRTSPNKNKHSKLRITNPTSEREESLEETDGSSEHITTNVYGSKRRNQDSKKSSFRIPTSSINQKFSKKKRDENPTVESQETSSETDISSEPSTANKPEAKKRTQAFTKPKFRIITTPTNQESKKKKRDEYPTVESQETSPETDISSEPSTANKPEAKKRTQDFTKPKFRIHRPTSPTNQVSKKKKRDEYPTVESQETSPETDISSEPSTANKPEAKKRTQDFTKPKFRIHTSPTNQVSKKKKRDKYPTVESQETSPETDISSEPSTANKPEAKKRTQDFTKPKFRIHTSPTNQVSKKKKRDEYPTVESQETSPETDISSEPSTANKPEAKKRTQDFTKPKFRIHTSPTNQVSKKKKRDEYPTVESQESSHETDISSEASVENKPEAKKRTQDFTKPTFRIATSPINQESKKKKRDETPSVESQETSYETDTSSEASTVNKQGAKKRIKDFTKPRFRIAASGTNQESNEKKRGKSPIVESQDSSKETDISSEPGSVNKSEAKKRIQAFTKPKFRMATSPTNQGSNNKKRDANPTVESQESSEETTLFEPRIRNKSATLKRNHPFKKPELPEELESNKKTRRPTFRDFQAYPNRTMSDLKKQRKIPTVKESPVTTQRAEPTPVSSRTHADFKSRQKPTFRINKSDLRKSRHLGISSTIMNPHNLIRKPVFRILRHGTRRSVPSNKRHVTSPTSTASPPGPPDKAKRSRNNLGSQRAKKHRENMSTTNKVSERTTTKLDNNMNEIEDTQQSPIPNKRNQPETVITKRGQHHFTGFAAHPAQVGKKKLGPKNKIADKIRKGTPAFENAKRRRTHPAEFRQKNIYQSPVKRNKTQSAFENAKKRRTNPTAFRHRRIYTPPVKQVKTDQRKAVNSPRIAQKTPAHHRDIFIPAVVVMHPQPKESELFPTKSSNNVNKFQVPNRKQTKTTFSNLGTPFVKPRKAYYFRVTGGPDNVTQAIKPNWKENAALKRKAYYFRVV